MSGEQIYVKVVRIEACPPLLTRDYRSLLERLPLVSDVQHQERVERMAKRARGGIEEHICIEVRLEHVTLAWTDKIGRRFYVWSLYI